MFVEHMILLNDNGQPIGKFDNELELDMVGRSYSWKNTGGPQPSVADEVLQRRIRLECSRGKHRCSNLQLWELKFRLFQFHMMTLQVPLCWNQLHL